MCRHWPAWGLYTFAIMYFKQWCVYIYIHVCLTDILTSYIYIHILHTHTYILYTIAYVYIYIYMLVPYDLLLRHDLLVYVMHIVHYTSKSYTFLHIYIYTFLHIFIYIYLYIYTDSLIDWLIDAYILYTICLYRYIWICVCIIHIIYVYYVYIYITIMDLLQDDYGFYGSGWKFGIPKSIGSSLSLDGHISTSIFSG